jgi:hypothetical protein
MVRKGIVDGTKTANSGYLTHLIDVGQRYFNKKRLFNESFPFFTFQCEA